MLLILKFYVLILISWNNIYNCSSHKLLWTYICNVFALWVVYSESVPWASHIVGLFWEGIKIWSVEGISSDWYNKKGTPEIWWLMSLLVLCWWPSWNWKWSILERSLGAVGISLKWRVTWQMTQNAPNDPFIIIHQYRHIGYHRIKDNFKLCPEICY